MQITEISKARYFEYWNSEIFWVKFWLSEDPTFKVSTFFLSMIYLVTTCNKRWRLERNSKILFLSIVITDKLGVWAEFFLLLQFWGSAFAITRGSSLWPLIWKIIKILENRKNTFFSSSARSWSVKSSSMLSSSQFSSQTSSPLSSSATAF